MAKDERWEPTDAWSSDDANFAAETTADQARAHYEPIVAELENSAESWRRVSERLEGEKRELEATADRLAAELKDAKKSRPDALVHKSLHDHVVGDLTARVKGLETELSRRSSRICDLEAQLSRGAFVPHGAEWCIQRINSAGVIGFESADKSESVALLLPDGPGLVHIVFVPDVKP